MRTQVGPSLFPIVLAALAGVLLATGLPGVPEEEGRRDQDPPEAQGAEVPAAGAKLSLLDGGRVAGDIDLERLVVETRYGTLEVPLKDIVQVRFSLRLPEEERQALIRAIAALGSDDPAAREEAARRIQEASPAGRRIAVKALAAVEGEVKERAERLLEELAPGTEGSKDEDALEPMPEGEEDEVVTERFTFRGTCRGASLAVATPFGKLEFRRDDLAGIAFGASRHLAKNLAVAGANTAPESWLNTKVALHKGQKLTIRAKGQLFVPNYNLSCGPEGTKQYAGNTYASLPMLSLVAKVGKNGKPFAAGRDYQGNVPRGGVLYLGVIPFRRNVVATGSYQVRIETGR